MLYEIILTSLTITFFLVILPKISDNLNLHGKNHSFPGKKSLVHGKHGIKSGKNFGKTQTISDDPPPLFYPPDRTNNQLYISADETTYLNAYLELTEVKPGYCPF